MLDCYCEQTVSYSTWYCYNRVGTGREDSGPTRPWHRFISLNIDKLLQHKERSNAPECDSPLGVCDNERYHNPTNLNGVINSTSIQSVRRGIYSIVQNSLKHACRLLHRLWFETCAWREIVLNVSSTQRQQAGQPGVAINIYYPLFLSSPLSPLPPSARGGYTFCINDLHATPFKPSNFRQDGLVIWAEIYIIWLVFSKTSCCNLGIQLACKRVEWRGFISHCIINSFLWNQGEETAP